MTLDIEVQAGFYDAVVELFEFDLSVLPNVAGTEHFYFTNFVIPGANTSVNFRSSFQVGAKPIWVKQDVPPGFVGPVQTVEYEPIPITATGFDRTTKGQIPQPELQISNIFGTISGLLDTLDDLVGVKVYRRRTLAKYLGNFPTSDLTKYFPTDVYYIERKASENSMSITFQLASPLDLEGLQIPKRVVTHNHCLWEYRGPICGYNNGRASEFNGLPVANVFDSTPQSGDAAYDQFNSNEKNYLDKLAYYRLKSKEYNQAVASRNLASASKTNACDNVFIVTQGFFDTGDTDDSEPLSAVTFALVRNGETYAIVWEGQSVYGNPNYAASPTRVLSSSYGNNPGPGWGVRDGFGGSYYNVSSKGNLSVAFRPRGVNAVTFGFLNGQFGKGVNDLESDEGLFEHIGPLDSDNAEDDPVDFELREVNQFDASGIANCANQTTAFNNASAAEASALTAKNNAYNAWQDAWNALSSAEQANLRENFDVCGKRLSSCQLRFGSTDLPYGAFPGSNLTRDP